MATLESITPCPVPRCRDLGHHLWDVSSSGQRTRLHEGRSVTAHFTVTAMVYEDEEDAGLENTVQLLRDGHEVMYRSRDDLDALVFALQDAADMAFPEPPVEPVITQADEDEFEAALAEVVQRAEHPIDVNRLVAAAIRFRRAYLGVDE